MSFARHGLAVFTWLFVPPPSPGTQSHSHSLAHAPLPANLHGSGRAAGWPRPPPRPASCPDEAAATGKRPRAALPGRRACGTRPRELGARCGQPGPRAAGRGGLRPAGPRAHSTPRGGRPEPAPPCFRRTATSRSSSTKGSRGSPRSTTNK